MLLSCFFSGLLLLALGQVYLAWAGARRLVLPEMFAQLMLLCLWVAPALEYLVAERAWYQPGWPMGVGAAQYFPLAIPSVLTFAAGLYGAGWWWRRWKGPVRAPLSGWDRQSGPWRWFWVLTVLGALAWCWTGPLPAGLRFEAYLCRLGLYGTLVAALWTERVWVRRWMPLGALALIGVVSLRTAMFGDALLALLAWALFAQWRYGWRPWRVLAVQALALLALVFVLTFKYEYRSAAAGVQGWVPRLAIMGTLVGQRLRDPLASAGLDRALTRLNQGKLTSWCYARVPAQQAFVRGETIGTAVLAAVVPRVLWPGKPQAGGEENCRRFFGIEPQGYSMNIGTVGEGYVNFGVWGWVYTGLWGFLLGAWMQWCLRDPVLVFAMPLLFVPLLLPEADLLGQLNHLVKATALLLLGQLFDGWIRH